MINSVWKPISKNSKISHYELKDNEVLLKTKGVSGYKVIWVCDDINCRTPNKLHSISACHLIKPKMCYHTQICRSCQCSGEGNGRFGDNRKWKDFLSEDRLLELKEQYSTKWSGDYNPSKLPSVKIKKKQVIIDKPYIEKICKDKDFSLINIINIDGKRSEFTVECNHGHISHKKYNNFTRKNNIFNCHKCFYNSIGLMLTDEELLQYEKYNKQVRALTAKTYRLHKEFINPNNLIKGKNDYHIDHRYSIVEGYKNNVSVHLISAKENLEMLKSYDNLSKQGKCSITLDELLSLTTYL
jgi:hypothetical protein